jgi:hypothetical protein
MFVNRPHYDGGGPARAAGHSESPFASAGDTGPAAIIVDDPTCPTWDRIGVALTGAENAVNWSDRDKSVPAHRQPNGPMGRSRSTRRWCP